MWSSDLKGEITGGFVIIRDVTDFVRQEQKAQQNYKELLRESEVLWEAIPDLVFRISKDEGRSLSGLPDSAT